MCNVKMGACAVKCVDSVYVIRTELNSVRVDYKLCGW